LKGNFMDYKVNEQGHLIIGELDSVELAKEYGTPIYILDEEKIRHACRDYKRSFDEHYNGNGLAYYASKALNCKAICKLVNEEGLGLDVVSGGELYTALKVGFPKEKINFHGNNKSKEELIMALNADIGAIIIDNFYELETLQTLAKQYKKRANIMFRITPGIDAHTHEFIKTGQIDSKFGFILETGEALEAVKKVVNNESFNLVGLHCHIGSQIFDIEPFILAAKVMINFIADIKNKLNVIINSLNLGGGFGISYTDEDTPLSYSTYMQKISKKVIEYSEIKGIKPPRIGLEPGRSIIGEAGYTLYTVGNIKEIPSIGKTYVCIDGGMYENPRYALYQAKHKAVIANKASKKADKLVTLAGRCCESGDLISENILIQEPESDDILAVFSTGAYNYSMASRYNRNPVPGIVMVNGKNSRLIVKPETYDDLIRNDI
jgi:diaminopimelate decarboxylase